jgi:hypothetical protein
LLDIDPGVEQLARQAADWYGLTVDRYVEIILRRELDRLADESPNMADVLALS